MTALAMSQVRYESLMYWRNRRRVFFTFAMPLMFVVIFGALYGNDPVKEFGGRGYLTFFIPGILGFSVILATFTSILAVITISREAGILKRVRGTPVPTSVYLAGHVGCVLVSALLISVVVLLVGTLYGIAVPWHALPGLLTAIVVGAATFTALGFGASGLVKSADSAPMLGNFVILPLTFISGIWGPPATGTLETIAKIFPVERVADALQHAYDPNVTGAAISANDLLVLGIWAFVGVRLAQRFLRNEIANA
jgi:ABC-2 type transport system permease protein